MLFFDCLTNVKESTPEMIKWIALTKLTKQNK